MKKMLAIILSLAMILTGCGIPKESTQEKESTENYKVNYQEWNEVQPTYDFLNEEELLSYVENLVYRETVSGLNSEEYVVEGVNAIYISNEYIEEVMFNSQSNIYFGYTLNELNEFFQDARYVFTLGEDGTTAVQELQEIDEQLTEEMLKNIAIGTGVILVCVTVSVVSAGVGAPAVSMIFAASAKTGTLMALSSGGFGAISAGVVRGIQTGDMEEAMEAAALAGSEGFKWGAISGAVIGGGKEAFALKAATKNGLTMNQAAIIQKESGLPMDVISQLHSMDEYLVYKEAGLKPVIVNGKTALVQNIDLDYVSQLPDGTEVTNLVRMQKGYAPLDPATGKAYQLHHIGQKADGTLAILTESQHQGNSAILNLVGKESEIDRAAFNKIRKEFWEYAGKYVFGNGGV